MFFAKRTIELKKIELYAITLFLSFIALFFLTGWKVRDQIRAGNSDFIIYYTAIQMLVHGEGRHLYDLQRQAEVQHEILASLGRGLEFDGQLLPYNHPPFQLGWYYPLSRLSYFKAWLLWNGVSLLCYLVGMSLIIQLPKRVRSPFHLYYLGGLAFLPVWITLIQGQDSLSLFLWFAMACSMFLKSKDSGAGFCLSLALQKFQLLAPFLLLLVWKRRWRALAGFLAGAVLLLLVSLMISGLTGVQSYGRLVLDMTQWTDRFGIYPSKMHSLRGQWFLLFPQSLWVAAAGTLVASILFLVILLAAWKGHWNPRQPHFLLQLALLFEVSLLVSPHLNFHDLSLALIPCTLTLIWQQASPTAGPSALRLSLATLVFAFPIIILSLDTPGGIPLRLSVLGLSGLALLTFREIRCSQRAAVISPTLNPEGSHSDST